MVRAKFKCVLIRGAEARPDEGSKIVLEPVTSGSPENESFFKYTPGGKIELTVVNPEAVKQFKEGEEYYVDFLPARSELK